MNEIVAAVPGPAGAPARPARAHQHRHPHDHVGEATHHHHGSGDRVVHSAWAPDHDHDHDDTPLGALEENPIWQQDNVVLHSVGIDIGSSGTQVLFSRLHLRRIGEDLASRYVVINRDTLYRSPVALTPYADGDRIDAEALGGLIDRAYAEAAMVPEAVDTGVVILTGEALRRRNAAAIGAVLAERGGDLVTATAGHHMEAMLAAYGSGAARLSHDSGSRILNIDIGGGTTKLSVVDSGQVTATAALRVGGRLMAMDDDGRLIRLEPSGRLHAARLGWDWQLGDRPTAAQLTGVAEVMADAVVAAVAVRALPPAVADLHLTEPLGEALRDIDGVMFSGGVAEYVYGREERNFGDLGPELGRALRSRIDAGVLGRPLLPAGECIRATALGASEYSVQLSGNTGWISDPDALLPRRNLQVVRPHYRLGEVVDADEITAAVRHQLTALDATANADVALALPWRGAPSYARLSAFARGLHAALAERVEAGRPLYLVLDGDVAMTLGRLLTEELGVTTPALVVDGLDLRDFDYIDLGRVRHPSRTVPVTIKSLVFGQVPETAPSPG